ncbi:Thioesterase/thiol ester dehydrase-isomerase [Auriscalpium vulgare]|uniref:Thioesterase/thiol ester dehydrase-isomerase n=1 Tax=Auriscalpium vulgare TaxID=40419 RepID=A0ACB8R9V4_9AGAM|nr:Thioesterase/thiol ester dehydrase-isomerase [Auriscalpium vulgare]
MSRPWLQRIASASLTFRRFTAHTAHTHRHPPSPRRRGVRTAVNVSALATAGVSTYLLGALYPHTVLTYVSPRIAPPPPDPDHPESKAYVARLEDELHNLPLLLKHRAQTDHDEWYETRPYLKLPEDRRVNNLTAGALRGPGKLALPPLVRARYDESECMILLHVGRGLCGHDGIVHGGLLATLLDESMGRTAILNLPDKIGVTANLNVNYKAPTRADQFIVLRVRLVEKAGRKTRVAGAVEDLDGNVLVEATSLFVQPRYSKLLASSGVREALGEAPAMRQPKRDPEEILPRPATAP